VTKITDKESKIEVLKIEKPKGSWGGA
jgi:hypothetical protein